MTTIKHGISIGVERVDSEFFLTLTAVGKLTHADYEMISPVIDAALAGVKAPEVNVLADVSDLEGWELRAAWDDFKLGLKHNNEFRKIAIYGNKPWQEMIAKFGGWFVSGEVKYFESIGAALMWLNE